jgi:hypothetical protein
MEENNELWKLFSGRSVKLTEQVDMAVLERDVKQKMI